MTRHLVFISALAVALLAGGCGTNPVTGKRELQLMSEGQEIQIGQQNYAPARQSQGGDYVLDPELTAYVREVGQKLAAVSDRPQLPYEFVVLNDSQPNAWAMPGGKIAFNRGLLYELDSEAELAAVLGHEIVHAAARHGAKGIERGMLLQGVIMAVGIGTADSRYSQLFVGGAQVAAQLANQKYGRDAESISDRYGMQYMKEAGYDPAAAVTLQETFVRLSEGRNPSWLEGLFASHPPSPARVEANRQTLQEIGAGGEWGRERYAERTAGLRERRPAYKAYDAGVQALAKGDAAAAAARAEEALAIEPREALFHELLGDVAMSRKRPEGALDHYARAMELNPDYFKPVVQSGIALFNLGRRNEARDYLQRSVKLLPTAPAHYLLGVMAEERGDLQNALNNYQVAAGSDSELGKQATQRFVRLDLPRNPERYIRSAPRLAEDGTLYAVVQNAGPVALADVRLRMVRTDGQRILDQSALLRVPSLGPGKQAQVAIARDVRVADPNQLRQFRVVVEQAEVAQ
ncbi:MAG: M48 family metalloprotease [Burkholderiales bacterium]|nr:M48 family metalloprotease [Burkholderiales bacterium]